MTTETNAERWISIQGHPEYEVSNFGRIRSYKRDRSKGRVITPKFSGFYHQVTLCTNGIQDRRSVHRIVAEHFLTNEENKPQVNHKDGDKLNNHVDNLEWVTPSENGLHAYKMGLNEPQKGTDHGRSILDETEVMSIYHLAKSEVIPQKEIAERFDVTVATVSDIKLGRRWGHITQKQSDRAQELEKEVNSLHWRNEWIKAQEEIGHLEATVHDQKKENASLQEALESILTESSFEDIGRQLERIIEVASQALGKRDG